MNFTLHKYNNPQCHAFWPLYLHNSPLLHLEPFCKKKILANKLLNPKYGTFVADRIGSASVSGSYCGRAEKKVSLKTEHVLTLLKSIILGLMVLVLVLDTGIVLLVCLNHIMFHLMQAGMSSFSCSGNQK